MSGVSPKMSGGCYAPRYGSTFLAESLLPETLGHNERLERIAEAFDWDRFGRLLARVPPLRKGDPATLR